jgi:hypothetical protein
VAKVKPHSSVDPLTGIWWDNGVKIVVVAHPFAQNSHQTGSLIDSNLTHAVVWPSVAAELGRNAEDEYFVIPRGRVLVDLRLRIGIIVHGPATNRSRLRQIARRFRLISWKAEIDDHYCIGADADRLFMDD